MPFDHDSFAYKVTVKRPRGDYQPVDRFEKLMALIRFLAANPSIPRDMRDEQSVSFTDPKTLRNYSIQYHEIKL